MRKEVLYSLAALSIAPVAVNAAEGNLIPGVITGNNWTGDNDNNNTNGIVQWVNGDVTFTINQELVPGSYTFTCQVKNPGAGVRFYVNDQLVKTQEISSEYTNVSFEFTLEESITGLQIKANGVINFQEGQSNDYFIKFDSDDNVLTQGVVFNRENFQNYDSQNNQWTTWKQPLAGINNAIDLYVNKTLTYESDEAKHVMAAEKEKIQNSIAPEKLTYAFYKDNQLYDPTVETNPIYIEATQVYNKATRIEAEFQADKIKEQVQEYLDGFTELDEDGNPIAGTEDPVAKAMADKLIGDNGAIAQYLANANESTGSSKNADGSFTNGKNTPVTFKNALAADGGFDIDEEASPLKDIIADANALTAVDGQGAATQNAGQVAAALQASFKAVADADSVLIDMFGPTDEEGGNFNKVISMAANPAQAIKTKSAHYLDSATQITAYYKGLVETLFTQVRNTAIKDMDAAFKNEITAKLTRVNGQLAYNFAAGAYSFTATSYNPLEVYATVYKNYVTKASTAVAGVEMPELTDIAKQWLENNSTAKAKYDEKAAEFNAAVNGAIATITVPDLITPENSTTAPKNYVELMDIAGELYKGTAYRQPKNTTVGDGTAANAALLKAFAAYSEAIDSLAKAYAWADSVKAVVDAAYEEAGENGGYDNRDYFKESFTYATLKSTTANNTTTWSLEKKVSKPGVAPEGFVQDATQWDYWTFLENLRQKLEAAWTKSNGANAVYNGKVEEYVLGTANGEAVGDALKVGGKSGFKYSINNFFALFKPETQANAYQKDGEWFAENYKDFYDKFEAYKAAVEKLRTKVASLPLYTANPVLYSKTELYGPGEDQLSDDPGTYGYAIPEYILGDEDDMTYKQILAKYDAITKQITDGIAELAANAYDNASTKDYRDGMTEIFGQVDEIVGEDVEAEDYFTDGDDPIDQILKDIEWFVAKNGIIDQQAKQYAAEMPRDNFEQLMNIIGGDYQVDEDGALGELEARLNADYEGDGFVDDDYEVGFDLTDLVDDKLGYDGETLLTGANVEYIQQLFAAYQNKFNEAKAIYDKYALAVNGGEITYTAQEAIAHNAALPDAIQPGTVLTSAQANDVNNVLELDLGYSAGSTISAVDANNYNSKLDDAVEAETPYNVDATTQDWTLEDYEAANGELGVAIAIINELNDSLYSQLEPAIMEEGEAQEKHKAILDVILGDRELPAVDPENLDGSLVDYQAGMVDYRSLNLAAWWNGRKGATKKLMGDAPIMLGKFNNLAERMLLNGGANALDNAALAEAQEDANWSDKDKELFDELKTIYGRIINVYKALDQSYRTRNFSAWNLKSTNVGDEINNTDLNIIENDLKAWVQKCIAEEKKIGDNLKALIELMTNSNYDDDVDEKWDWFNLITGMNSIGTGEDEIDLTVSPKEEIDAALATILSTPGAANLNADFAMVTNTNLLQTTGIQALLEHDANSYAADMLEPIYVNEDCDTIVTHQFYNMLADSSKYQEPTVIEAAARALVAEAPSPELNGELYLQLRQFVADVNTMFKNRTLNDNLAEMQKRFDDLAQNILLIDEHAAANKKQHERMLEAVEEELGNIAAAQETVDAMPDGAVKDAAQNELDNATAEVNSFKDDINRDYVDGKAWETGATTQDQTKVDEDAARAELRTTVQEYIDKATGTDEAFIAAANEEAYEKFQNAYQEANLEFSLLAKKLEQLKNLNADVPEIVKTAGKTAADNANVFLFGKTDPTATDVVATATAKDKLDKIYQAGTDAIAACDPVDEEDVIKAWSGEYKKALDSVKNELNKNIKAVDDVVDMALAYWTKGANAKAIYKAAEADRAKYVLYLEEYADVMKTKPTEPAANASDAVKNAYKTALQVWNLADTASVERVIASNPVYDPLYEQATELDDQVDLMKKTLELKDNNYTGKFTTYPESQLINLNNLFKILKDQGALEVNGFTTKLDAGKDTAAVRDAKIYIDYAIQHLQGDTAWLKKNGFPLDETIVGATESMQTVLDAFDALFVDGDNDKVITRNNHDALISKVDGIQEIVGELEKTTDADGKLTGATKWLENGRCAFVHNLKENADSLNKAEVLAALEALVGSIDETRKYIQDYQVAPQFAAELQSLEDMGAKIKDIASSKDAQDIAISIKDQLEGYKKQLGTVKTLGTKEIEDWADVIGTMNAESSTMEGVDKGLPGIVKRAFAAEKNRLKADINEMRAEFKELPAAQQRQTLNDSIEALWSKVDAAKCDTVLIQTVTGTGNNKVTKNDFGGWTRTDLVALQKEVMALYKKLREATDNNIDEAGLIEDLDKRIAEVKKAYGDKYAEGAPTVQKLQEELDALVSAYETVRDSVNTENADSNFVDYNREKLEAMVQNAELKYAARNAEAKKIADLKKALADTQNFDELIQASKDRINNWLKDVVGIEAYDLASNEASALYYEKAAELADSIIAQDSLIANGYDINYAQAGYSYKDPDGKRAALMTAFNKALTDAEDAAARYDISARLGEMTAKLQSLILKYENNEFDEDVVDQVEGVEADGDNPAQPGLIATIQADIKTISNALKGNNPRNSFNTWLDAIEKYVKNNDGDLDLVENTILDKILDLEELLETNVIGDMDGNGRVTLLDARMIADIAMGNAQMPALGSDKFKRADIIEDDIIDMADAAAAVNIFFYGNPEGIDENMEIVEELSRSTENDRLSVTSSKTAQGLTRLAISLDNAQAYTAFQMDIQLPEGMKFAAASLSGRTQSQLLLTNTVDEMLRIGAISLRGEGFADNNGAVLYLDFEVAEGAEENFARFQNVFFVDKKAQKVEFQLGGITPTGIQSANAETAIGQKIYDLGGRMKSSLKKGVNIIRDAAGNAKKLIVK